MSASEIITEVKPMSLNPNKKTVGVIAAMASEIDALKASLPGAEEEVISGVTYVYGELPACNLVMAQCGIGKVFAAMCAQTMILRFHPDQLLNIGVGGSLTPKLNIADVCIATAVVQHDLDTTGLGDPMGMVSGINVVEFNCAEEITGKLCAGAETLGIHFEQGIIASGDQFISDADVKKRLVDSFHAIVCEMEGGAIGHVCYVNQVPFAILRAVSDNGDENAQRAYEDALDRASDVAIQIAKQYLGI